MFPSLPSGKPIKYLLIAAIALAIGCSTQPDNPPPTQTDLSESTASEPTPNNNDLVSAAVDATVEARAAANQALATAELAAETAIELTITAAIEATSTARQNNQNAQNEKQQPEPTPIAPPVNGETFFHGPFSLQSVEGKPVLLNFWFPSCPPYRAEMPDLQEVYQRYGDRIAFVGIQQLALDTVADGIAFAQQLGITYPLLPDTNSSMLIAYEVLGFPTTVFLDKNHNIVRSWTGIMNLDKMIENLDALLEESPAKDQPVTIPAATPTPAPTPTTIPAEIASSCDFAPYPDSAPQFADVSPGQLVIQPSGISVFDLKIGEGATPGIDDTVEVHYAGWLTDGCPFDSSYSRGQTVTFPVGGVIPGFRDALLGMRVGGQRRVQFPPELGYGDTGAGSVIPGGATLIFDIVLEDINP